MSFRPQPEPTPESIEKTKNAIEIEKYKIRRVESTNLPEYMENARKEGLIIQWRKYPRFFFVNGVKKARIVLDEKTGTISHRYLKETSKEEYNMFRDVFNKLNKQPIN